MWEMANSRRQTRSTRRRGPQTDAQFWSNQPDPVLIERGQANAIRLVRSTINPAPGSTTASEPMEVNATNTMVFVDDEGLEEQFLTDGEDTPNCRGITRIHRSPSRLRPSMRPTATFINIHEHLI